MAEEPEGLGDLTPGEGLSNFGVQVAGLDNAGNGFVIVRFEIANQHDPTMPPATLSFRIAPDGGSLESRIARAYDELILALRQMLYGAALARAQVRKSARSSRTD